MFSSVRRARARHAGQAAAAALLAAVAVGFATPPASAHTLAQAVQYGCKWAGG